MSCSEKKLHVEAAVADVTKFSGGILQVAVRCFDIVPSLWGRRKLCKDGSCFVPVANLGKYSAEIVQEKHSFEKLWDICGLF